MLKKESNRFSSKLSQGSNVSTYAADFGKPGNKFGYGKGQSNTLLVKFPVGKSKPPSYNLPPDGHVYGMKVDRKADESTETGTLNQGAHAQLQKFRICTKSTNISIPRLHCRIWPWCVVLTQWQTKQKSKNAIPSLDYIAMNKASVKKGIIDPKGTSAR
jgi:hypothetical protein